MTAHRFEHFKDYFSHQLAQHPSGAATLSELVKNLGYSSPSLLSMISKGQRLPSPALLEALLDRWSISQNERDSVRVQVEIERRLRKKKDVLPLLDRLGKMQSKSTYRLVDPNQYEAIRRWYIHVLKEMVGTKNFVEDPVHLSRRLCGKVSPSQIKKGLETLLNVGLIKRNQETGRLEPDATNTTTANDVPSEAIQEHHRSMLDRAKEALTEQTVEQRHFTGLTLRFDPRQSTLAKERIYDFVKKFNEELESAESEQIFQLNVQFFEHTRPDSEPHHALQVEETKP